MVSDIPLFHEVLDKTPGRAFYFKEGNINSLKDNLERYFSDNISIQSSIKELNEEKISLLSSERMAREYLKLYKKIIPTI